MAYQKKQAGRCVNIIPALIINDIYSGDIAMTESILSKSRSVCKAVFFKPENLSVSHWNKRRFCSVKCANIAQKHSHYPPMMKICPTCGVTFYRESRSVREWYERRVHCSPACKQKKDFLNPEILIKKILSKTVMTPNGCLEKQGCKHKDGYGYLYLYGKRMKAHRAIYELANGQILDGMCVCHHCDNPPCINPDHLFLGTQTDNIQDMIRKGRDNKHSKYSDDVKKRSIELAVAGMPYADIESQLGIGRKYISALAVKYGFRRKATDTNLSNRMLTAERIPL